MVVMGKNVSSRGSANATISLLVSIKKVTQCLAHVAGKKER